MHAFLRAAGLLLALSLGARGGAAQVDRVARLDPPAADSAALLDELRSAQARFERTRRGELPWTRVHWGGDCDEIVGRMCMRWTGGSDWWPEAEEPASIAEARTELLDRLGRGAERLPGDDWIAGQRVFYLVEAGRMAEAGGAARACEASEWWCAALEGYAAHRSHDHRTAAAAFDRALAGMDPDRRTRWTAVEWLLDGEGRDALGEVADDPAARTAFAERFLALSDPLWLVGGNDFRTEILARRVVDRIRADAGSPYALRWGDDLSELLVRYGWEIGWERSRPPSGTIGGTASVVGHQHPEGRDLSAPGAALVDPVSTTAAAWNPGRRHRPLTGHAPAYAPVVHTPEVIEISRVPRGETTLVVARIALGPDTTHHAAHDHPPLPVPERWAEAPVQAGLFAVPLGDGRPPVPAHTDRSEGATETTLALELPAGDWLLGAELWDPAAGRAARHREGIRIARVPPDVVTVSDLLIGRPGDGDPETLEDFLPDLLSGPFRPGDRLRVGWELHGLGWREEEIAYEVTLEKEGGGLLHRLGRAVGLVGDPDPTRVAWSEGIPELLGPRFRSVVLGLPTDMEPGVWRISVSVASGGRGTLTAERTIRVIAAR